MTLAEYFITNAKLQKEWAADKNPLSPEDLGPYSSKKVWWRCEKGHEWQTKVNSRVSRDRRCPYCSNRAVAPGENDLATVMPEIATLWHPTRNASLKPTDVTPGCGKKVWWRCEKGHEWQANTYAVTAGSTCPYCAGKKPIVGETDLATTHPFVIDMWSAKNKLAPTDLTAGSQRKVWFVCPQGHEWYAQTFSVVHGSGCPYCAGSRAIPGETDLATVRPELLTEWDFEKNPDLDPSTILPSSHKDAWWKCELGHSWQAAVFSRTREKNATGCPYCSGKKVLSGYNDLATLKPLLVKEWHLTLNGELTPEQVSPGSNKKVWWQCDHGHVWQAPIYARAKPNGTGCPVCAGRARAARRANRTM